MPYCKKDRTHHHGNKIHERRARFLLEFENPFNAKDAAANADKCCLVTL
ncbi:MAG: hypothetical protein WAZ77_05210 [Candidatus Nitrosopolaris sp.]